MNSAADSADAERPLHLDAISGESPTRGRRGPYRSGIRQRERILSAATEVFARHGYAGSSLRQIASEVGVTPAAILVHFGSKEGLLMAVLDHWTVQSSVAHHDLHGVSYLRSLTDLMRRHLSERGFIELFSTMATEASDPAHPAHDFMTRRYEFVVGRVAKELSRASALREIRPLDARRTGTMARRVVAMMDGLQIQWLLDPSVDLVGEFDDFIDAVIAQLS